MLVILVGVDGAGKSTVARSLVDRVRREGGPALLLQNYSGRRSISAWTAQYRVRLHPRLADAIETAIRALNVLISHARARRFEGLVVMDRYLYCQLALRNVRGLPRGRLLPWLIGHLPQPDLMVLFDIPAEQAFQRINRRGTDHESLNYLHTFSAAYAALPEYPGFARVAAEHSPAETLSELEALISRRASAQALPAPSTTVGR